MRLKQEWDSKGVSEAGLNVTECEQLLTLLLDENHDSGQPGVP